MIHQGENSIPVFLWFSTLWGSLVKTLHLSVTRTYLQKDTWALRPPSRFEEGYISQASDKQYSNLEFSALEPECSETHIKDLLMIEAQLIFII